MKYEGIPHDGALPNRRHYRREFNGVMHRLCTGPGHDVPTWLPEDVKYFYKQRPGSFPRNTVRFLTKCRLCQCWHKVKSPGLSGYVPISVAWPFFAEAVHRVGMAETARRTGISFDNISNVYRKKYRHVQKRTLRSVMLAVISMRRKNEVYHKRDIKLGIHHKNRKRPLLRIKDQNDLYKPTGDNDNDRRRNKRRDDPEVAARDAATHTRSRERRKQREHAQSLKRAVHGVVDNSMGDRPRS